MTMRALGLYFRYLFSENSKIVKGLTDDKLASNESNILIEKIEKLLQDPKFWKYSKDNSLKVTQYFLI
jgi:hypothetical protein